jgi:hypothetical protein
VRIRVADPLALLAIQAGKVNPPATEQGAAGDSQLDSPQRAVKLGEPVPIVFGRRRDGAGGVFISPGATEARFQNDTSNNVTAFYHLVLSEGEIDSIQVRDVFQRACRVGSFTQTYNRRAGTWIPENAIVAREGFTTPEAPLFCGSIGNYPDISTLSFQVTIPDGFDQWNRQVHVFVRGGFRLLRLLGGTGPSDNFADLVLLAWRRSRRVPDALIDLPGMASAAQFLEANGLLCNAWIQESRNLADFISRWAPYFLLGQGKRQGLTALRPLLPVNNDGTINTDPIDWVYLFDEELIIPGSEEIEYSSLSDRQPFVAQITWRQEVGSDVAIIRTSEVSYAGTAEEGPFEQHDLSEFCTSENNAVKVGAHILARRLRSSHTLRFQVKPQAHNTAVGEGSIVRVRLRRQTPGSAPSVHDYLYQVERIGRTLAGNVSYECSHFPIDAQGRSLIALDVAAATATGVLLSSNKTGVSCDVNSSTDQSVPFEVFTPPSFGDLGFPVVDGQEIAPVVVSTSDPGVVDTGFGGGGSGGGPGPGGGDGPGGSAGSGPSEPEENPNDGGDPEPVGPMEQCPVAGGAPGTPPGGICAGATVTRIIGNIGDEGNAIRETGGTELYSLPFTPPEPLGGDDYNGKFVVYEWECPDGSKQRSDPCEEPEQEPDPNGTFTPTIFVGISVLSELSSTQINCSTGQVTNPGFSDTPSTVLSPGVSYEFRDFGTKNFERICVGSSSGPSPNATAATIRRVDTGQLVLESGGNLVLFYFDFTGTGFNATYSASITATDLEGNPVDLEDFRDS